METRSLPEFGLLADRLKAGAGEAPGVLNWEMPVLRQNSTHRTLPDSIEPKSVRAHVYVRNISASARSGAAVNTRSSASQIRLPQCRKAHCRGGLETKV